MTIWSKLSVVIMVIEIDALKTFAVHNNQSKYHYT